MPHVQASKTGKPRPTWNLWVIVSALWGLIKTIFIAMQREQKPRIPNLSNQATSSLQNSPFLYYKRTPLDLSLTDSSFVQTKLLEAYEALYLT